MDLTLKSERQIKEVDVQEDNITVIFVGQQLERDTLVF